MKLGNVIAQIPARGGSKRVPSKNMRYLLDKPLLGYAIEAALACSGLDDIYVNTDSDDLEELALSFGCKVYRRPPALGSDTASGDDFTIDFMNAKQPDTVLMVSPVCPLIESSDIQAALDAYDDSSADTLISCTETRMQTFCDGRAVNIDPNGPLAPTQINPSVFICNWAVTIWNVATFRRLYDKFGGGYCGEKRLLWPIEPWKSVKISVENDFIMAEKLLLAKQLASESHDAPRYWSSPNQSPAND